MHLAQLNIADAKYPLESTEMSDFVNNLEPINAIAESSEGFIWRLKDDSGNATDINPTNNPNLLVNMSVWKNVESLKNFMFRTHHIDFLKRKKEWFNSVAEDTYVLWWIEEDKMPTVDEAFERLAHLRENGDTPYAFTFKSNFTEADL